MEMRRKALEDRQAFISETYEIYPLLKDCANKRDIERNIMDIHWAVKKMEICKDCTKEGDELRDCDQQRVVITKVKEDDKWRATSEDCLFFRGISPGGCSKGNNYRHLLWVKNLISVMVGQRYKDKNFDNFILTESNKKAYMAATKFIEEIKRNERPKGLLLTGGTGSGKTHLSVAIIRELFDLGNLKEDNCRFIVVPELMHDMRESYRTGEECRNYSRAKTSFLVIFDDLGSEKPSEWVREQMFLLINYRYNNCLPTIITTNYDIEELEEKLSKRVVSRLFEMCDGYLLKCKDYRKQGGN